MKKQRQEITEGTPPSREINESKRQRLPWRRIAVFGLLGVALVIGSWLACDLTFTTFTVGGKQLASRHYDSSLKRSITAAAANYRLTLAYPDKTTKSYTWADMGLSADAASTVRALRHKQYTWSHFVQWWRPITAPLQVSANKPKLTAFVKSNASIVVAPAQNAQLTIVNGTAQIVSAVPGKQYSLSNAESAVREAASSLSTQPLALRLVQLPPARNDASLAAAKAQLTTI
ncbi:MAG TPA: peptidoglycan binding domain-containing protein, partial [Candidatus Saccharimonadales bacterium]